VRIIGEYKDYYDGLQRHGQDQEMIYLRRKEQVETPFNLPYLSLQWESKPIYARQAVIGFCGKLYPLVQLMDNKDGLKYTKESNVTDQLTYCFSLEEVDDFFKKTISEDNYNYFKAKKWNWSWSTEWWHRLRYVEFREWFEKIDKIKDKYSSLFEDKYSPTFVASAECHDLRYDEKNRWTFIWNECLADYGFYRKFDSYSAYQEITMFLGSVASPEKEIPEMTDKIKAEHKGFDKWSFRKPPQK